MTPLVFTLVTFLMSLAAGALGSLLGLGGGIIVIPVLTLLLGIDIRYAIGASVVSVILGPGGWPPARCDCHHSTSGVRVCLAYSRIYDII